MSSAELWSAFAGAVAEMEKVVFADPRVDTDEVRAEGLRYLTRIIAGGIPLTMERTDPAFPELVQFLSPAIQFGLPAADCHYHWAAVHGDHTYRVAGHRGGARLFDIETRQNHMAQLAEWTLLDRRADFDINPDGSFEVILSRDERPGNWLRLPDGPGNIIIRQYYYDWLTEQPAELTIERLDSGYPPAPRTAADVEAGLRMLIRWIRTVPAATRHAVEGHYTAPDNALEFVPLDFGWADLLYGKGHYSCAPDEAVIVEVTPPVAPYWGIQLVTHYWEALDWHQRQTSINGHQAVLDEDGAFRAVIAHTDPGVPNWLDTAGRPQGLIAARYFRAESTPVPTLRTIPLTRLRDELPTGTAVVTPAQRQDSLRARARSVRRRRCDG
ncbi:MAG TPA: DUF1214 domain-containing protein [Pseudonocardia sp.]